MARRGRPPGTTQVSNELLVRALKLGTPAAAARELGLDPSTVRKHAARIGIVWAPVTEDMLDEVVETTVRRIEDRD